MKKQNLIVALAMIMASLSIVSCSKSDDYKKYTDKGEISYTGKLDSVNVYSGRLRVRLVAILPADPKIVKCKISWNDNKDSIIFNIVKAVGPEVFDKIFNVDEGVKNFSIQTFDNAGNASVIVTATGIVYGPKYEAGLTNRPVLSGELLSSGNAAIVWDNFDTTSGAKGTILTYTTTSDVSTTIYTPVSQSSTTLSNYKLGSSYSYKTMYLPSATDIDTLYSASQIKGVKSDITSLYLSNMGPSFQRNSFDGRWGTLAAPWVTNAAAKNKGGVNGGYSSDAGGVINWETWGNTPVTDGIVYQATATPLPAGSYSVSFDEYSEIQSNSSVYCIAAAGGNGIPVLADLSTSLGYVALFNGASVGGTSPNTNDTRSFTFIIATAQVVSIGFLANIVGSGNPGSYFQVKKVRLFSN
ncbi:MAG: DUF4998 domain-containing protein [Ferruginibacter sp.]